jgi:hypothetical protein
MIYTVSVKNMSGKDVFEPKAFTDKDEALISASNWVIERSPPVEITVTDNDGVVHFSKKVVSE